MSVNQTPMMTNGEIFKLFQINWKIRYLDHQPRVRQRGNYCLSEFNIGRIVGDDDFSFIEIIIEIETSHGLERAIDRLLKSMLRRVRECVRNKDGSTHYY